ncbi:hypothetical protein EEDFHM_03521 [Methylorubrum populi]
MKAWFRSGGTAQPTNASSMYEADGRHYVELWNVSGTLVVHRVLNDGRLKQLERWPRPDAPVKRPMRYHLANNVGDLRKITKQTLARIGGPMSDVSC